MKDPGQEEWKNAGQEGCKDAGQEGCRKGEMQEWRIDLGQK